MTLLLPALVLASLAAGSPDPQPKLTSRSVDFSREVRPILSNYCYQCHGPDDRARKAGLRLDVSTGATKDLPSGDHAIVPGKPDESELLARLTSDDPDLKMPPRKLGKKPTPHEVEILRSIWRWRDWLIRTLNANVPYDRFTTEMIAGDLLPNPTADQVVATGFHRNTTTNTEGGANAEEYHFAVVVDRSRLPEEVAEALAVPAGKRSPPQNEQIAAHHRASSAEWSRCDAEVKRLRAGLYQVALAAIADRDQGGGPERGVLPAGRLDRRAAQRDRFGRQLSAVPAGGDGLGDHEDVADHRGEVGRRRGQDRSAPIGAVEVAVRWDHIERFEEVAPEVVVVCLAQVVDRPDSGLILGGGDDLVGERTVVRGIVGYGDDALEERDRRR